MGSALFNMDKSQKPCDGDNYGYIWRQSCRDNTTEDDGMWVKYPKCTKCEIVISPQTTPEYWECITDDYEVDLTSMRIKMYCPGEECDHEMWLVYDFLWTDDNEY